MVTKRQNLAVLISVAVLAIGGMTAVLWKGGGARNPGIWPPQTPHEEGGREFSGTQKVGPNAELRLGFGQKMDPASVSENLEWPEGLKGETRWEENVMVLKPEKPLEEGREYVFSIAPQARTASGAPLNQPMEFRFMVSGPPALSAHYPLADAKGVEPETPIRLIFDRPMVPLGVLQGSGAIGGFADWPVTFQPPLAGTWRWLGTSAAEFTPHQPLKRATAYTVKVPAGLISLSQERTQEEQEWQFSTARPEAMGVEPFSEGFDKAGPKQKITLNFNQEMDLEKAKPKIRLMQIEGKKAKKEVAKEIAFSLAYGQEENEAGERTSRKDKLTLTPNQPLPLDSPYKLEVEAGLMGAEGELGTEKPFHYNFLTVGELKVEKAERSNWGSLEIEFSNPVEDEKLAEKISISPAVEGWEELEMKTNRWSGHRALQLSPELKPSTRYTLSISNAFADRFGQKMKEPFSFSFQTPALEPRLEILSEGEFGILEAGKPAVYSLKSVNIATIEAQLAPLPLADFIALQKNGRGSWSAALDFSKLAGAKSLSVAALNKLNQGEVNNLDMEKMLGAPLQPGLYALRISSPQFVREVEGKNEPVKLDQVFALTRTALTLKYSATKALVWAVDMKTGEPAAQADIKFHAADGTVKLQGRTDKDGFFESPLDLDDFVQGDDRYSPLFWVTSEWKGDFSFVGSRWGEGFRAWNFGMNEDFQSQKEPYRLDSYLYTERELYRAGDTVHFKAIARLRDKEGQIRMPKEGSKARLQVSDARGNQIMDKELEMSSYGSVTGDIPIDPGAPLGSYEMRLQVLPENEISNGYTGHSFRVAAFRKPESELEATPKQEGYFSGQTLEFDLKGAYFFGAPMSGAEMSWVAQSESYWFNRYTDGWYSFALEDDWCWEGCSGEKSLIGQGSGTLDEKGEAHVSFPFDLDDKPLSQIATLEATVTDQNNQSVSVQASVPVHKAQVYVGIRSQEYAVQPHSEALFDLVTVDTQGQPVGGRTVTVELMKREWNTVKKKSVDGRYYYDNEAKDTAIASQTVTSGKDGKAVARIKVQGGGSYRVVAQAKDEQGRIARSAASLYAFSSDYVNWPHSNNDRIEVLADKPEYAVGDTAKLLIKSPYQGESVKALITVEKESVIRKMVIPVLSNAQPFEIQITPDLAPNAYVSAIIIKPRDGQTFDENGTDTGMPGLKVGYAQLKVETSRKRLDLKLSTDKKNYRPGETVQVSLKAADWEGRPVQAEISLGVVDLSLISLLGFTLPDPIKAFYQNRGLGVRTAEMLSLLVETFKPGAKGGGGGDAEGDSRKDFKDTAFWAPSLVTDKKGEAETSFKLPDNLTTWQLLAIGQTQGHLYGAAVAEIIENKEVILRPALPRFAVMGDRIEAGAIVHNFLGQSQTFAVSLEGSGFTGGSETKKVTVKPQEQKKLVFPITVTDRKSLTLHFKAEGPGGSDEVELTLPVHLFATPQSVATFGVTEGAAQEQVYLPAAKEALEGSLTAMISPTVAVGLPEGLEYLREYPYGCSEQILSGFLGNLALAELGELPGFDLPDRAALEKQIVSTLEKLYTFQRSDGGFGYWPGSLKSFPYLSAYIAYALDMTEKSGYPVDDRVMSRTVSYLKGQLRRQNLEDEIDLTTRAYMLYVLAQTGQGDESLANNLYERRDQLPVFAKSYLAMSYAPESKKAQALAKELLGEIKISARGAHFEERSQSQWRWAMGSNQNTTALALQAMVRILPANEQLPKVVRHMLSVRQNGHWDSTQSTLNSLFALRDYLKATGELEADFQATVSLDGQELIRADFDENNVLTRQSVTKAFDEFRREAFLPLSVEKQGEGRLYYELKMDYLLTLDRLEAISQGMGIQRSMSSLEGKAVQPGRLKAGETYRIGLTITVPEDRHFVAVSSPLPAGLEPLDFSFKTTQASLGEALETGESEEPWRDESWRFNHIEFRDDAVLLFADQLPAGVYRYDYLVRATTPGRFRYRPAHAEEMYFPENFGQTDGNWVEVKE